MQPISISCRGYGRFSNRSCRNPKILKVLKSFGENVCSRGQAQCLFSHLLSFTDVSRRKRSEETPLRVTCERPYVSSNENGDCEIMKM